MNGHRQLLPLASSNTSKPHPSSPRFSIQVPRTLLTSALTLFLICVKPVSAARCFSASYVGAEISKSPSIPSFVASSHLRFSLLISSSRQLPATEDAPSAFPSLVLIEESSRTTS